MESSRGCVQHVHCHRGDAEHPTVETERTSVQTLSHDGIGGKVPQRKPNIFFRKRGQPVGDRGRDAVKQLRALVEPLTQMRQCHRRRQAVHQRVHRFTSRMSANHNVRHAQHTDSVFDGSSDRVRVGLGRRHDVPDVLDEKQVAGLTVREQIGSDPRVCAGEKQRARMLSLAGETSKQLPIPRRAYLLEPRETVEESLPVGCQNL